MLWFLLETSFCTGLRQDPFWEILASFWDVSGSSGKIERPLDGKKRGRHLEESMNGSGGGSLPAALEKAEAPVTIFWDRCLSKV